MTKSKPTTKVENPDMKKKQELLLDLIAPAALKVDASYVRVGDIYARTLFVYNYPRFLNQNWLAPIINLGRTLDISKHLHPKPTR